MLSGTLKREVLSSSPFCAVVAFHTSTINAWRSSNANWTRRGVWQMIFPPSFGERIWIRSIARRSRRNCQILRLATGCRSWQSDVRVHCHHMAQQSRFSILVRLGKDWAFLGEADSVENVGEVTKRNGRNK